MASASGSFRVPRNGPIFIAAILERCEKLIQYGIWGGLPMSRLRSWFANFATTEEKYFAACVLDSLIYRSDAQTVALSNHLFQRLLPDLSRIDPPPVGLNWIDQLRKSSPSVDPRVRIIPVVRPDESPTKSGYIVARLLKRNLRINERWIIQPQSIDDHLKKGTAFCLFIDDFLGTGDEFESFVKTLPLDRPFSAVYAAYTPLVAYKQGLVDLRAKFPHLRVMAVETLDESHRLFHPESHCFEDGINEVETVKTFYYDLLDRKGIRIDPAYACGYGRLELAYAFEHAIPDNNLPILWWSSANGWNPLFVR